MTWTAYRVVFKLKSPMHIGCSKVGNIQRTRPYVTGRVFWGALTMRLTRDKCQQENRPATNSKDYYDPDPKFKDSQGIGNKVNRQLAYTYFYPAIWNNDKKTYDMAFPWQNESQFRRRFLSSYASTALVYPQQAADEGLLHEVEFISPRTLDKGEQVYLVGYVFEQEGCNLNWKDTCQRLQMGGERGYGWGAVACNQEKDIQEISETRLFNDDSLSWKEENEAIVIQLSPSQDQKGYVLAHTIAQSNQSNDLQGEIEPLVGREWTVSNQAGEYVAFSGLCWVPGSEVARSLDFVIGKFGIWDSPT